MDDEQPMLPGGYAVDAVASEGVRDRLARRVFDANQCTPERDLVEAVGDDPVEGRCAGGGGRRGSLRAGDNGAERGNDGSGENTLQHSVKMMREGPTGY